MFSCVAGGLLRPTANTSCSGMSRTLDLFLAARCFASVCTAPRSMKVGSGLSGLTRLTFYSERLTLLKTETWVSISVYGTNEW